MSVWIHRISHNYALSKPLIEAGYISIGFSEYSKKYQSYADKKNIASNFDKDIEDIYWTKMRQRFFLDKFLFQIKQDDLILVPLERKFSIYRAISSAFPISEIPGNLVTKDNAENDVILKDGLFYNSSTQQAFDLGFAIKVEEVCLNISRADYCGNRLVSRLKIRQATANIDDLANEVEEAQKNFKENKPINLETEIILSTRGIVLDTLIKKLKPGKLERLIKWYFQKIGADTVEIPAKNKSGKSEGADADIVAIFEKLKCQFYVQAKLHEGYTSSWAIEQIVAYREQMGNSSEYTYLTWVVSTASFDTEVKEKAAIENVRLIDGNDLSQMIIETGISGIDEVLQQI